MRDMMIIDDDYNRSWLLTNLLYRQLEDLPEPDPEKRELGQIEKRGG